MLINVYDSPPNSSYKIKQLALGSNVDTMSMGHTLEFIASLNSEAILLVRDRMTRITIHLMRNLLILIDSMITETRRMP